MDMRGVFEERPVLAIMRNVPMEDTLDYARAVVEGGVTIFEVALNSVNGYEQISMLRKEFGSEVMIGAGTAITVERAERAMEAGAGFLLTPSTQAEILDYCREHQIPFLPGALTPSDVAMCVNRGYHTMKLFPAGDMPSGYIKSLKGPFDSTEYVAIGGVKLENIRELFGRGYLGAGLGSNIMPKEVIRAGKWAEGSRYIKDLTAEALAGRAQFRSEQ